MLLLPHKRTAQTILSSELSKSCQNALDACRYRKARLEYLKTTGRYEGHNEEWEGKIIFRQMKDDNNRTYIECEDNGIGMAMLHLSQCFARAGRRFADTSEFIKEQAEWLKCDPPIRLYPNSQFGVGVLSYFMLADEIEIETCRLSRKGKPGESLRVRIPGSSGLFRVQKLGVGNQSGTRIRLYLNRTHHKGQLISCIETLRRLLWVAEFNTSVYQFGRQDEWMPGCLKHPMYSSEDYLTISDSDIWWVPEDKQNWYENDGCILADGIWTKESQPGFVVNLRRENYPKLTVDRKEVVKWDKDWVYKSLIQDIGTLANWRHADLDWIWKLARKHPWIAKHIINMFASRNSSLPLGIWGYGDLRVSVTEFGCFPRDEILSYIPATKSIRDAYGWFGLDFPWYAALHRLVSWNHYKVFNISEKSLNSLPVAVIDTITKTLHPDDGIIISTVYGGKYSREYRNYTDYIPSAVIISAAWQLNKVFPLVVKSLQRFSKLGLSIPKIDAEAIGEIDMTEEDLISISIKVSSTRKTPWPLDEVSFAHIALSSTRLSESIYETSKRLSKFSLLGLKAASATNEFPSNLNLTSEDTIILSRSLNGEEALLENQISPTYLVLSSQKLGESINDTAQRFSRLSAFGLKLPEYDLDAESNISVSQSDLIALSDGQGGQMDGTIAWPMHYMTIARAIQISERLNESIFDTFKRLQKFASVGLRLPEVNIDSLRNFSIAREDVLLFSEREDLFDSYVSKRVWLDNCISCSHVVSVAKQLEESVSDTLKRLQRFEKLGLIVPKLNSSSLELLQDLIEDENNLVALSRNHSGYIYSSRDLLKGNVKAMRIILASLILDEPLKKTLERFYRFKEVLGLTLPEGEPEEWRFEQL